MHCDRQRHPHAAAGRGGVRWAFTLVEVMITVVILAISAAVVVPMIGDRSDVKLSSATRKLIADLQYAQNLAIATRQPTYVKFVADQYSVCRLDGSTLTPIKHPVDKFDFVVTLGSTAPSGISGVGMAQATFDGSTVLVFNTVGAPLSFNETTQAQAALTAQAQVTLACGGQTQLVNIEPYTGEITAP